MLTNKEISKYLSKIAQLLTITGENQFKVRAFENASRTILQIKDLNDLKNKKIKGIGKSISAVIEELLETGNSTLLEELQEKVPDGIIEMLSLKGLGAKKIKILMEKLGISNIGELEYACNENRLLTLKGFGEKTQKNILSSIAKFKMRKKNLHFATAEEFAKEIFNFIFSSPHVEKLAFTGEIRRKQETISNIEFVVVTENFKNFIEFLETFAKVVEFQKDFTRALVEGINLTFYFATLDNFLEILFVTTGSENFINNDKVQSFLKKGKFINDKNFFKSINSYFIPPECREYFIATEAPLNLIHFGSLKGIFHVHTTYSDGVNSLEEIVEYLKFSGYSYVGISDHSKSAYYANGLSIDLVKKQHEEIDELNEKYYPFKIFKGIESDILKDGSLDYPDNILELFDFIIASVHSSFNLSEEDMTRRIIKAVENPFTTIIGHPTGRLLLYRDEYKLNMDLFLQSVAENKKFIEINSHPYRLDLSWQNCLKARDLGIKLFINPDAHNLEGFEHVKYGIITARKAFLSEKEILNSYSLDEIHNILKK